MESIYRAYSCIGAFTSSTSPAHHSRVKYFIASPLGKPDLPALSSRRRPRNRLPAENDAIGVADQPANEDFAFDVG